MTFQHDQHNSNSFQLFHKNKAREHIGCNTTTIKKGWMPLDGDTSAIHTKQTTQHLQANC
ncbi:hypothetical protein A0J61_05954 [Choanephora cucurbitarum]|uniref:Uncharacterized protein n=1 Tax=Choanephora cucurbitarum TaxID=101091 RepID=A0A1C7NA45_9FUNG|nr:hypothetical protein A0J61_05954 [Choanephora cucurbitarum]